MKLVQLTLQQPIYQQPLTQQSATNTQHAWIHFAGTFLKLFVFITCLQTGDNIYLVASVCYFVCMSVCLFVSKYLKNELMCMDDAIQMFISTGEEMIWLWSRLIFQDGWLISLWVNYLFCPNLKVEDKENDSPSWLGTLLGFLDNPITCISVNGKCIITGRILLVSRRQLVIHFRTYDIVLGSVINALKPHICSVSRLVGM